MATGIAEIAAATKKLKIIIGFLKIAGIIPFIAPKKMATVVPFLLTFHELINKITVVATTPAPAAPAPKPDKAIAKANSNR